MTKSKKINLLILQQIILIVFIYNLFSFTAMAANEDSKTYSRKKQSKTTTSSQISFDVLGNKSINNLADYNKNSNIIDREEIESNNYNNAYEILDKVPGVTLGTSFKDVIDIRGQGEDARRRVQVLFDDVPINLLDNTHYFPGYNIFPSSSIESIEILPGGGSVIYGNGTQGGVVNILTNFRSEKSKPINQVYAGIASYNTKRYAASLGNNFFNDKLFLQLSYSGENNNAYLRGEKANTDFYSLATKVNLTNNQILGYSYSYYTEDGLFSGVVSKNKLDQDFRASGILYPRTRKKEFHQVTYQAQFLDNLLIDNATFYTSGTWKNDQSGAVKGTFYDKISGNKFKTKIFYAPNQKSSLLVGSDLIKNYQKIELPKGNPFIYEKNTAAIFALNKTYWNSVYAMQGYRFNYDYWVRNTPEGSSTNLYGNTNKEYYRTFINHAVEAGIGLDYYQDSSTWLRYETGFAAPEASELVNLVNGKYINNNIKYETYHTLEAGATQQLTTTNTYLKGVVFYTYTRNEINRLMVNNFKETISINLGNTGRLGAELSAEQYLLKDIISIAAGVTFIDSRLLTANTDALNSLQDKVSQKKIEEIKNKEGKRLAKVPPVTFNARIKIKLIEPLIFATNVNYIAPHIPTLDKPNERVGGRVITDMNISFTKNDLTLSIGVNNLTDEKYFILNSGGKAFTARPAMGRNYFFDIRYKL